MIEIAVILVGCDSRKALVEIFIGGIARESISADRLDLRKVDLFELRCVVECVVANLCVLSELNFGQLSRTVECGVAESDVIADRQRVEGGSEYVVVDTRVICKSVIFVCPVVLV